MRFILFILGTISFLSTKAQMHLPVGSYNYAQWQPFPAYKPLHDSLNTNQRWYVTSYASVSAGYSSFYGGGGTFISAPVGLQLNHPLNNNLIAFAGVSVAPVFFNFNRSFTDPVYYKSYPGGSLPNAYGFGMNSRVEMGLMYVNDARTFSISGSIGYDRSSYPVHPTEQTRTKAIKGR